MPITGGSEQVESSNNTGKVSNLEQSGFCGNSTLQAAVNGVASCEGGRPFSGQAWVSVGQVWKRSTLTPALLDVSGCCDQLVVLSHVRISRPLWPKKKRRNMKKLMFTALSFVFLTSLTCLAQEPANQDKPKEPAAQEKQAAKPLPTKTSRCRATAPPVSSAPSSPPSWASR